MKVRMQTWRNIASGSALYNACRLCGASNVEAILAVILIAIAVMLLTWDSSR